MERIRKEEGLSVSRLSEMVGLSRATYYRRRRKKSGKRRRRSRPVREVIEERVRELAEGHPCYGYRKIWALARKKGLQGSLSTVYRTLKEAGLLLEPSYQQELREDSRARKRYLHRPTETNELWQVDLTQVPISDYGVYWVTSVVDYYSRYVLVCHFSSTHTAEDVIDAVEKALEEARLFYVMEESEVITLVSDNGLQFTSRRFRE